MPILKTFLIFTNAEYQAKIFEQSQNQLQLRLIQLLSYSESVNLFTHMSKDDVADTLGRLPINIRKDLLNEMKGSELVTLEELLGYSKDSAGGIMTTEYIALRDDLSIKDALHKIKKIGPKTEVIEVIFILNNLNELIGTADLRDILTTDENDNLLSITNSNLVRVLPDTDQEQVSQLVSKYDLKAIAVVNQKNRLLGIITIDDIIDVIVKEQTEDILRLGGVSSDETIEGPFFLSVKRRLPWLVLNLWTAFLAAFTISLFEDVIIQVVALASSMSIVSGMGGNAGNQTLAVVIRSIALGEIDIHKSWKLVFREIALGIFNGIVVGLLAGIYLYIRVGNPFIGLVIFAAMIANMIVAGFFGFTIPLVMKYLKIDPALASTIFLTTTTDVLGFLFFLGLASLFLPWLV